MDLTSYLLGKNSGGGSQVYTINASSSNFPGWHHIIEQIDSVNVTTKDWTYLFANYDGIKLPNIIFNDSVTKLSSTFYYCIGITSLDLTNIQIAQGVTTSGAFRSCTKLAVLDISTWDFHKISSTVFTNMFSSCGTSCLQSDGAYANKIPYIYVKDEYAQNWILNQSNGRPTSWTTDNVIIKQ